MTIFAIKIDGISHKIYAAWAVLIVLIAVGGFALNKIWEPLVAALKAAGAP
jgi:hypothetical protein